MFSGYARTIKTSQSQKTLSKREGERERGREGEREIDIEGERLIE